RLLELIAWEMEFFRNLLSCFLLLLFPIGGLVIRLYVLLHFFKSMTEHLFQGIVDEEQTRVQLGFRRILSSSSSSPSFTAAPRNSGRSILRLTFQATGEPKRRTCTEDDPDGQRPRCKPV